MEKPRIGLLPMYIELYDRVLPDTRIRVEAFQHKIAAELGKRGLEILPAPVCRVRNEFEAAVADFEKCEADMLVTLHLAYSPSLESANVLAATKLPIVVLDTTETYEFGPGQSADEIMYNHGIHGVQDMCSMLLQKNKSFQIEVGHWRESNVLDRITSWARAAQAAARLKSARVGIIGEPFEGMGDFAVSEADLKKFIGIETIHFDMEEGKKILGSISNEQISAEMEENRKAFSGSRYSEEVLFRTSAVCLEIRKWIGNENLSAFTANFMAVDKKSGLPCMPFLEAGKAMSSGTGYAGEGDILTAALVGALASAYGEVSFTEMFCPDWKGNSIFLSHMGEMNLNLAEGKPLLIEKSFPYTDAGSTLVAYGCFKPGKALIMNAVPGCDGKFTLILVPGEMLPENGETSMQEQIRGWFRPEMDLSEFFTVYSRNGGTHHSALIYGVGEEELVRFGQLMSWEVVLIK